jgi:hypothetical protein
MSERWVTDDTDDLPRELLVSQAADEFLASIDQGESPDVEAYAVRFPQVADVLRFVLPALRRARQTPAKNPLTATEQCRSSTDNWVTFGSSAKSDAAAWGSWRSGADFVAAARRVEGLPFAATLDDAGWSVEQALAAYLHPRTSSPCTRSVVNGVYYAMQMIDGGPGRVIAQRRQSPHPSRNRTVPPRRGPTHVLAGWPAEPETPCGSPDTTVGSRYPHACVGGLVHGLGGEGDGVLSNGGAAGHSGGGSGKGTLTTWTSCTATSSPPICWSTRAATWGHRLGLARLRSDADLTAPGTSWARTAT